MTMPATTTCMWMQTPVVKTSTPLPLGCTCTSVAIDAESQRSSSPGPSAEPPNRIFEVCRGCRGWDSKEGMQTTLTWEPTSGEVAPLPWTWLMGTLGALHKFDGGGGGGDGDGGGAGVGPTPLQSGKHHLVSIIHALCSCHMRTHRLQSQSTCASCMSTSVRCTDKCLSPLCLQHSSGAKSRRSTMLRT